VRDFTYGGQDLSVPADLRLQLLLGVDQPLQSLLGGGHDFPFDSSCSVVFFKKHKFVILFRFLASPATTRLSLRSPGQCDRTAKHQI